MSDDGAERGRELARKMIELSEKVGDTGWRTVAGMHAVDILERQGHVTVDEIIQSLQDDIDGTADKRTKAMNEAVIDHLRRLPGSRSPDG